MNQQPLEQQVIKPENDSLADEYSRTLNELVDLKIFLASAPANWTLGHQIKQYELPTEEIVSCILWNNVFYVTGTDIVRCLTYRFMAFGREVRNKKKFEEGIFSDLRNLKCDSDAILEEPKSPFLDFLYKKNCVRTQKKQKIFHWYSVGHDRLFLDALERDLKKEWHGKRASTESVKEPALSFQYDGNKTLVEQLSDIIDGIPKPIAAIADASTSSIMDTRSGFGGYQHPMPPPMSLQSQPMYAPVSVDEQRQLTMNMAQGLHPQVPYQQMPVMRPQFHELQQQHQQQHQHQQQQQSLQANQGPYQPQQQVQYQPVPLRPQTVPLPQQALLQPSVLHQQQQTQQQQVAAPVAVSQQDQFALSNEVVDMSSFYYSSLAEEPLQVKTDVESDFPLDYFQSSFANTYGGESSMPLGMPAQSTGGYMLENNAFGSQNAAPTAETFTAPYNNGEDVDFFYGSPKVVQSTPDPTPPQQQQPEPPVMGVPSNAATLNPDSEELNMAFANKAVGTVKMPNRGLRPMTHNAKVTKAPAYAPTTPRPEPSLSGQNNTKIEKSFLPTPSESGSDSTFHDTSIAAAPQAPIRRQEFIVQPNGSLLAYTTTGNTSTVAATASSNNTDLYNDLAVSETWY